MMIFLLTKKRQTLSADTVNAFVVSKSIMRTTNWSPETIPINKELIKLFVPARASYEQSKRDKEKEEARKAQQEMERNLQEEIAKVKEASKRRKVVLARANKKKEEIEQQFAEKNQLQKLLIEAQQKANEADKKLEALRKEKDRLR